MHHLMVTQLDASAHLLFTNKRAQAFARAYTHARKSFYTFMTCDKPSILTLLDLAAAAADALPTALALAAAADFGAVCWCTWAR